MTQPLLLIVNIFAIEVPEDASAIETHVVGGVQKIVFSSELQDPLQCGGDMICLPPGSWRIIGMAGSVTWTQAAGIVEHYRGGFVNYNTGSIPKVAAYSTPFLSLNSLLTSKNLDWKTTLLIKKVTE